MQIILRAVSEKLVRKANKQQGMYYEQHHILPRSLNGANTKNNLVLLTGKEHFICHWLLVKMYPKESIEYEKMLYAFWYMSSVGDTHTGRYVNARVYEVYRIEFSKHIGQLTQKHQTGKLNSQYGKVWITNSNTGVSQLFPKDPGYPWVKGRYIFNGRSTSIRLYLIKRNREKRLKNNHLKKQTRHTAIIRYAQSLWDLYHNGNYTKLEDFAVSLGCSKMALSYHFKKYIPVYTAHSQKKRKHLISDKALVGVYF